MKKLWAMIVAFGMMIMCVIGCSDSYEPMPIPEQDMKADAPMDCEKAYDPCGPAAEPPVCAMEVSIFYNAYGRCINTANGLECVMTDRVVACTKGCNVVSGRCFE